MGSNQPGGSGTGYSGSAPSSWSSLDYNPLNQSLGYGQYFPGSGGISTNNNMPFYQDPTIADASLGLNNWSFSPGGPSASGNTSNIEGYIYGGNNPWNPSADALPIYSSVPSPFMQSPMQQTQAQAGPAVSTGPQSSAGVDQSYFQNPLNAQANTPTPAASTSVPANSGATWNPQLTSPSSNITLASLLGK